MISQTNNGCNLLSLILAMLLLLNISCENTFVLPLVTVHTACPFSIKKCVKMSVFYGKTVKICWRLGAALPHPLSLGRLGLHLPDPQLCPPPLYQILGAPLETRQITSRLSDIIASYLRYRSTYNLKHTPI